LLEFGFKKFFILSQFTPILGKNQVKEKPPTQVGGSMGQEDWLSLDFGFT
jgi:hypothetical protein